MSEETKNNLMEAKPVLTKPQRVLGLTFVILIISLILLLGAWMAWLTIVVINL